MFKILFLILVVMCSGVYAQSPKQQSFKFDEFQELPENDWKRRFDRLAEMQKSYPESSLNIIVYAQTGSERTSIDKIKSEYKNYLRNEKKAESVFVVSGGYRNTPATELWILPKDASSPKATPDEKFIPEKFAEFGTVSEDEFKKHFDDFLIELNKELDTGYIINYGKPSDVSEREKLIRDNISFRNCDAMRLVIVNGGESESLKTVLWIVPYGAEPPTP